MCGNFFNPSSPSFAGGGIGRTIAEVGLGVAGFPELAAGFGAAYGGLSGGGIGGAISGGLSGYGAGTLGGNLFGDAGIFSGGGSGLGSWASNLWGGSGGGASTPVDWGGGWDAYGGGQGPGIFGGVGAGGDAGASPWYKKLLGGNPLSTLSSIGSGLYGMKQSSDLKSLAASAASSADPWGTSGGRALAGGQLQNLLANPGQVASTDPAYQLRIQAAQRANATSGQGSGAMAVAAANASTDWYNQRLAQLGGISGANQNPAAAGQLNLEGNIAGNNLASQSLASIGYGINTATGGSATSSMPPAVRQWLQQQGLIRG